MLGCFLLPKLLIIISFLVCPANKWTVYNIE